jgi:hypothetical protein
MRRTELCHPIIVIFAIVLSAVSGCDNREGNHRGEDTDTNDYDTGVDGDADGDTDTDTDTDSNAVSDSDTDTDSDANADTDMDTDTDGDGGDWTEYDNLIAQLIDDAKVNGMTGPDVRWELWNEPDHPAF